MGDVSVSTLPASVILSVTASIEQLCPYGSFVEINISTLDYANEAKTAIIVYVSQACVVQTNLYKHELAS